jgi:hypothetical protein
MWFRRDMGYTKKLKNGHMKVQIQKEKNDEHMKAHKRIHVLKMKTEEREIIHVKRSIILVYHFPHMHILI